MPRLGVVYHPGKVRWDQLQRAVARVEESATEASADWEPTLWYETTTSDSGRGLAERAIADGATVVAAAGGDGTARAVAAALLHTGVPLALLPSGTGNLFARNLGVPLGVDAAARIAFEGTDRAVDVGILDATRQDGLVAGGEAFLVMAGMGIDAEMLRATNPALKRTIGWMAYADAVWRTLPKSKPFRLTYRVEDGKVHQARVHSMIIANSDMLPGGLHIVPDSTIEDGLLDLAGFQPRGLFGIAKVWVTVAIENSILRRFAWGRRISDRRTARGRDVIYRQGTRFALHSAEPIGIQADGEDLGDAVAVAARVEPGALLVRTAS